MVFSLGFGDVLSVAQTIGIIATLLLTLYFSQKQIKTIAVDLETRVLNDIDEKVHNLIEIAVSSPELILSRALTLGSGSLKRQLL